MDYIKDINLNNDCYYNIIIEIPKGTNNKFELVEPTFNRVECVRKVIGKYPFYYGCFPQTYAGDKDPLDVILISNKKFNSLDIVKVDIIGVIKTIDNGEIDDKLIAVTLDEEHKHLQKEYNKIMKFLYSYKGKKANTIIDNVFYEKPVAEELINSAHKAYIDKTIQNISNIKSI